MKKIKLRCDTANYEILIGRGLLASIGRRMKALGLGPKVLIVSNRRVAKHFLATVRRSLSGAGYKVFYHAVLYGDERDKSQKVLSSLWHRMAQIPLERGSTVLALGGGVVGDLAGFAAATYMRGIHLVQVPTTLLAQVDSAIGGKTAINLAAAKNIVGAFYQPKLVLSDVTSLSTLVQENGGEREIRNSFAEVIKYGVILDEGLFRLLERRADSFMSHLRSRRFTSEDYSFLESVVWRSAKAKASVVKADERETRGRRMILNFGHTFAHGFEAASGFRLPHGRAVAVGMGCAAHLAVSLGLLAKSHQERLGRLLDAYRLPVRLSGQRISTPRVLTAMQRDKKKEAGSLRFVLPVRIGKVVVRDHIPLSRVRKIIRDAGGI